VGSSWVGAARHRGWVCGALGAVGVSRSRRQRAGGVVLSRAGGDAARFGVWVFESVAGLRAGVVVPAGVGRGVRGAQWCAVVSLPGRWGGSGVVFFGVERAVVWGVLVGW